MKEQFEKFFNSFQRNQAKKLQDKYDVERRYEKEEKRAKKRNKRRPDSE